MRFDDETINYAEETYGSGAGDCLHDWELMVNRANPEGTHLEKLETVNQFFNSRMIYAKDIQVWGIKEFWATPFEFMCKGAGDCEDYAIAKFFTLKEVGVPERNLNIMYGKRIHFGTAHMVLGYYRTPEAVPLILDNITDMITLECERPDLRLSLGFNTYGLWPAGQYGKGGAMLAAPRLREWRNLQTRLAAVGIRAFL